LADAAGERYGVEARRVDLALARAFVVRQVDVVAAVHLIVERMN